jgi:hypothetical protein
MNCDILNDGMIVSVDGGCGGGGGDGLQEEVPLQGMSARMVMV